MPTRAGCLPRHSPAVYSVSIVLGITGNPEMTVSIWEGVLGTRFRRCPGRLRPGSEGVGVSPSSAPASGSLLMHTLGSAPGPLPPARTADLD